MCVLLRPPVICIYIYICVCVCFVKAPCFKAMPYALGLCFKSMTPCFKGAFLKSLAPCYRFVLNRLPPFVKAPFFKSETQAAPKNNFSHHDRTPPPVHGQ